MSNKEWRVYTKAADFNGLAKEFNIDPVVARILVNRDIKESDIAGFVNPDFGKLHDPFLMKGMREAVDIIHRSISNGERIRAVGDYDIDGTSSCGILVRGLTNIGAYVDARVPHRIKDGYGINKSMIDIAKADGVSTIITCDNGIAAREAAVYAKECGVKLIITDHHEVPYEIVNGEKNYIFPDADVIIDPKQPGCEYPFKELCGAGVAWKLICALGVDEEILIQTLQLAAFATIGDIVSLQGENRILAKKGLELINKLKTVSEYYDSYSEYEEMDFVDDYESESYDIVKNAQKSAAILGLNALINVTGYTDKNIGAFEVGFILGPCINAAGRLDDAMNAVNLFLTDDYEEALVIASKINELNNTRKNMTLDAVNRAIRIISQEGLADNNVIICYIPDCHEALAGLVAGRITAQYYKPTIILTDAMGDFEGQAKASARSIEGFNMHEALTSVSDLLLKFGGHKMAAGFSINISDIPEFTKRINEYPADLGTYKETVWIDVPMPPSYVSEKLINEINMLAPFGEGNKKPLFAFKGLKVVDARVLGQKNNFLKLLLEMENGKRFVGVKFISAGDKIPQAGNVVSVTYFPEINIYDGNKSLQLRVEDFVSIS